MSEAATAAVLLFAGFMYFSSSTKSRDFVGFDVALAVFVFDPPPKRLLMKSFLEAADVDGLVFGLGGSRPANRSSASSDFSILPRLKQSKITLMLMQKYSCLILKIIL